MIVDTAWFPLGGLCPALSMSDFLLIWTKGRPFAVQVAMRFRVPHRAIPLNMSSIGHENREFYLLEDKARLGGLIFNTPPVLL
jgi:hypothetical protein